MKTKKEQPGLGSMLKRFRSDRALRQKDLVNGLGITTNYLSLLENGHRKASLTLIEKVAKRFLISAEALIFISYDVPDELPDADKEIYLKLKRKLLRLL